MPYQMMNYGKLLIEKVYAKLHGSYAALASAFIDDGLFDLTWLTSKKMVIGSDKMNNSNESDKLWNILLTNLTLEHNNKDNKQKDKIIFLKYRHQEKEKERKIDYLE